MIVNAALRKTEFYGKLSNFSLVKCRKLNRLIGLDAFKSIVKKTFFRFFNPKLQLPSKATTKELIELRQEMTFAEISHFIGFSFVMIFAMIKIIRAEYLFSLWIILVNILMNLYPSLLQQENKGRIDRFLKILSKKQAKRIPGYIN